MDAKKARKKFMVDSVKHRAKQSSQRSQLRRLLVVMFGVYRSVTSVTHFRARKLALTRYL